MSFRPRLILLTYNFCSPQVCTLEALCVSCACCLGLFQPRNMHHVRHGVIDRDFFVLAVCTESHQRVSSLGVVSSTNSVPGRFRREEGTDSERNRPDPLKHEWELQATI